MVRVHVLDSTSVTISGTTFSGPLETVADSLTLGTTTYEHGEFLVTAAAQVQTLPYLREELAIVLPFLVILAFFLGVQYIRRGI